MAVTENPAEETAADPTQPLAVSETALATVLEVRAQEDDPANTALKVAKLDSKMAAAELRANAKFA